jgi:MFS superfamily sulfate permease-like transporter|tara:strand:+ start:402 stop:596 length:195 start_codon:yes stop_codon:yes gene_type:complete
MCNKSKQIIIYVGGALTVLSAFFSITTGIYFGVLTNMFVNIFGKESCSSNKKTVAKKTTRPPYL